MARGKRKKWVRHQVSKKRKTFEHSYNLKNAVVPLHRIVIPGQSVNIHDLRDHSWKDKVVYIKKEHREISNVIQDIKTETVDHEDRNFQTVDAPKHEDVKCPCIKEEQIKSEMCEPCETDGQPMKCEESALSMKQEKDESDEELTWETDIQCVRVESSVSQLSSIRRSPRQKTRNRYIELISQCVDSSGEESEAGYTAEHTDISDFLSSSDSDENQPRFRKKSKRKKLHTNEHQKDVNEGGSVRIKMKPSHMSSPVSFHISHMTNIPASTNQASSQAQQASNNPTGSLLIGQPRVMHPNYSPDPILPRPPIVEAPKFNLQDMHKFQAVYYDETSLPSNQGLGKKAEQNEMTMPNMSKLDSNGRPSKSITLTCNVLGRVFQAMPVKEDKAEDVRIDGASKKPKSDKKSSAQQREKEPEKKSRSTDRREESQENSLKLEEIGIKIKSFCNKPFKCKKCVKKYTNFAALRRHYSMMHMKDNKYKCHVCPRTFAFSIHLNKHLYTHRNGFYCAEEHCQVYFLSEIKYIAHREKHRIDKERMFPMKCQFCTERFKFLKEINDHHKNYHQDLIVSLEHQCHMCGVQVERRESLPKHWDSKHGREADHEVYTRCEYCQQAVHKFRMEKHMKVHKDELFKEKLAETVRNIDRDMRKNPSQLLDATSKDDDVIVKSQTESRNQIHLCNMCRIGFTSLPELKRHILSEHSVQENDLVANPDVDPLVSLEPDDEMQLVIKTEPDEPQVMDYLSNDDKHPEENGLSEIERDTLKNSLEGQSIITRKKNDLSGCSRIEKNARENIVEGRTEIKREPDDIVVNTPDRERVNLPESADLSFQDKTHHPSYLMEFNNHRKKGIFACKECGRAFYDISELEGHIVSEHNDQNSDKSCFASLEEHVKSQHFESAAVDRSETAEDQQTAIIEQTLIPYNNGDRKTQLIYACSYCKVVFMKYSELETHMFGEHMARSVPVYKLNSKREVIKVQHWHSCKHCHMAFPDIAKYNTHMMHQHKQISDSVSMAEDCLLSKFNNIYKGVVVPSKPLHACYQCQAMFEKFSSLEEHIFSKHKPETYVPSHTVDQSCNDSGLKIENVISLSDFNIKQIFSCTLCPSQFNKFSDLETHISSKHKPVDTLPVDTLPVDTLPVDTLPVVRGVQMTSGTESYVGNNVKQVHSCGQCGASFHQLTDLEKHMFSQHKSSQIPILKQVGLKPMIKTNSVLQTRPSDEVNGMPRHIQMNSKRNTDPHSDDDDNVLVIMPEVNPTLGGPSDITSDLMINGLPIGEFMKYENL